MQAIFPDTERSPSPAPPVGPSHGGFASMGFCNVSPPCGQQSSINCCNTGHFFRGCCPSGTACSTVGTSQSHSSYRETCLSLGSSLHESTDHCQQSFPAQVSYGLTALFQKPTCSGMGLLHDLQVDLCIPVFPHDLQRHSCSTMGCSRG